MKILQIINSLSAGGAEVFASQLSVALKRYGDIEMFTFYGVLDNKGEQLNQQLIDNGIRVSAPQYLKKGILKQLLCPYQIRRKINEFRPDICHVHLDQCELYVYLASVLAADGTSYIRTIHNIKRSARVPKATWRFIDNFYDLSVHCSTAASTHYLYSGAPEKYTSINNGITLPKLVKQNNMRCMLGLADDVIVFVNIGSFTKRLGTLQKGQDLIINAMTGLRNLNIMIIFLGDGNEQSRLMELSRKLGVFDKFLFVGQVEDPYEYMAAVDALIMPSRFEGLPLSAIESVSYGLPLIASDIPAFLEFNLDSTILFKSESIESLQTAMLQAYNNIGALKKRAHANATEYQYRFDIDRVAERYYNLYVSLLEQKRLA